MSKLFVDEIQPKTTGGAVTLPNKPAFRVRKTAIQTASGNNELVTWDSVELNIGSHFAGNLFTAPVAGVYAFDLIALTTNDNATHVYVFRHIPNGGSAANVIHYHSPVLSGHETVSGSFIHQMGAGDTMGLYLESTNDAIYGDTASWTNWSGHLIG